MVAAWSSREPRRAMASSWGTAAAVEMRRALPAYTPPSRGSTRRSTTSSPSRSATRSPTETSRVGAAPTRSTLARARPASERTPLAARSSRSNGTPIRLRGSRRRAPRDHTWEAAAVGCTTSIPRSAASATPSGRRASIASAPTSTVTPATSARRSLPPTSGEPSSTSTSRPARTRSRAAVRPPIPAPTTTTSQTVPATRPAFHVDRARPWAMQHSVDRDRPRPPVTMWSRGTSSGNRGGDARRPTPMTTHAHPDRRTHRLLGLVAAIAMTAALAACSSSDGGSDASYDSSEEAASPRGAAPPRAVAPAAPPQAGPTAPPRRTGAPAAPTPRPAAPTGRPSGRAARHLHRHRVDHQRRRARGPPRRAARRGRERRRRHRGADRHRRGRGGALRPARGAGAGRQLRRRDDRPRGRGRPARLRPDLGGRQHPGHRHRRAGAGPGGQPAARGAAARPGPGAPGHHLDRVPAHHPAGRARLAQGPAGLARGPDPRLHDRRRHQPHPRRGAAGGGDGRRASWPASAAA